MRVGWLEALIRRGIEDGIYAAEVVPHPMAKPAELDLQGCGPGRLMREDVDIIGAVRTFFMMHAGRLQARH